MSSTTRNVILYSTDVVLGKQTQEMCICNWIGVWSIHAHIHTNNIHSLLLQAMNLG